MKAVLEFNMEEDEARFHTAVRGMDYYLAILDIMEELRTMDKYSDGVYDSETMENVRKHILEILNERNISLDEVP